VQDVFALAKFIRNLISEVADEAKILSETASTRQLVAHTEKRLKDAFVSASAGLITQDMLCLPFDVDDVFDELAKKVHSEFRKKIDDDVNSICANAKLDVRSVGKDFANLATHFAEEGDSDSTGGATPYVYRSAAPAKISRSVKLAVPAPARAQDLVVDLGVDPDEVANVLVHLFPGIETVEGLMFSDEIYVIVKRRTNMPKKPFHIAQVQVAGCTANLDVPVGKDSTDTHTKLLKALTQAGYLEDEYEVTYVTCGSVQVDSGEDKIQLMHQTIDSIITDYYNMCLASFKSRAYDEAMEIARCVVDMTDSAACTVDAGISNHSLLMSVYACIQAVQALELYTNGHEDECSLTLMEARDLIESALRLVRSDNIPGFSNISAGGEKLRTSMSAVHQWIRRLVDLAQQRADDMLVTADDAEVPL
jgi:hypothetical protein